MRRRKNFQREPARMNLSVRLSNFHDAGHRAGDLGVAGRLGGEVFAAVGSQLVEASAAVVGRETPLALDPAIQFKPLESGVEGAFFDAEQVVGQLVNELRD